MTPDVTAIILTYNRLPLLRQSLASARAQRDVDLEIIVVVNGSTDGTREWLATIDDDRIRVVDLPENISPTRARNIGIDEARGQWLGFLDDDDLWAPDKLREQLAALAAADAAWGYTGCVYIDEHGRVTAGAPPQTPEHIVATLPVAFASVGGLSTMVWRHDALGDDNHLDEHLLYADDWDLALRLVRTGPPACAAAPLVAYRQHPASWSRTSDAQRDEFDHIDRKHAALRGGKEIHRFRHHRYVAAEALRSGARMEALAHYAKAIRLGDAASIPRAFAALLPSGAQEWLRRRMLSDTQWMAAGERWLADLTRPAATAGGGR